MLETTSSSRSVAVEAPAKVNLTLRVLRRRADGYHDLESVVAAVSLFDTLIFEAADDWHLTCHGEDVPDGDDNLALKAARLLHDTCGVRGAAHIHLEKRIPPGRGFGGGSSDAAATLIGLNDLWGCRRSREDLAALGAHLGSDVPLFFGPPISIVRGRGERIEPASARCSWHLVLSWPDFGMPTAQVYAAYDRLPSAGNRPSGLGGPAEPGRPAATDILDRLAGPAQEARTFLVNDLEAATRNLRPGADASKDVRAILERAGGAAVAMTGSGSAYFALTDTEAEARRLAEAVRRAGVETAVVKILGGAQLV